LHRFIGDPDRRKAGCFGGHHIDADPVVHGQTGHTGTCKLQDLVFYEPVCKNLFAQRQSDILRSNTPARRSFQPYEYNLRRVHVICIV
jgi:hypothetical protein